jgi:predicted nucleotidyltransferase
MDEKLRSAIGTIHQDFPVEKVYVFGSFARREQGPDSDIDLLVVFREAVEDPFEAAYQVRKSLHDKLDVGLDVIVTSKEMFDRRHTQPWTIEHVASTEGVAV